MLESQELEPDSYSPHSPTPSSYDSVSSDAEDDANTNNIKKHKPADMNKPKIITTQPKLTQRSNSTTERTSNGNATAPQRPSPPKPLDMRSVPRMRSAPPPPPANRKSAAPPRPTWCYLTDFLASMKMVMCKAIVSNRSNGCSDTIMSAKRWERIKEKEGVEFKRAVAVVGGEFRLKFKQI